MQSFKYTVSILREKFLDFFCTQKGLRKFVLMNESLNNQCRRPVKQVLLTSLLNCLHLSASYYSLSPPETLQDLLKWFVSFYFPSF